MSSRSYQGHATDADINAFVRNYQHTVGTRLDDCQTCHKGAIVHDDELGEVRANPCDFCHYVIHPPAGWTDLPDGLRRDAQPLRRRPTSAPAATRRRSRPSPPRTATSDGYTNEAEIQDLRYPGDAGSYPGLPLCPVLTVTMAELRAMPSHTQFGLANTNKQQFDFYANYKGVKIKDLLEAEGVDLAGATSVDVLAPDGFAHSFTVAQITEPYPGPPLLPRLRRARTSASTAASSSIRPRRTDTPTAT